MSRTGDGGRTALRIGDISELTGATPRTIRYYEEIGLLPPPAGRQSGRHRTYSEADVQRLRELLALKRLLGVSLEELKELAAADGARAALRREWGTVADPERREEILHEGLGHVDRKLALVRRRRDEIAVLERELTATRRRLRDRLRELERARPPA